MPAGHGAEEIAKRRAVIECEFPHLDVSTIARIAETFAETFREEASERPTLSCTTGLQSLHTGKSRPSINQPFTFVILESLDTQ